MSKTEKKHSNGIIDQLTLS